MDRLNVCVWTQNVLRRRYKLSRWRKIDAINWPTLSKHWNHYFIVSFYIRKSRKKCINRSEEKQTNQIIAVATLKMAIFILYLAHFVRGLNVSTFGATGCQFDKILLSSIFLICTRKKCVVFEIDELTTYFVKAIKSRHIWYRINIHGECAFMNLIENIICPTEFRVYNLFRMIKKYSFFIRIDVESVKSSTCAGDRVNKKITRKMCNRMYFFASSVVDLTA